MTYFYRHRSKGDGVNYISTRSGWVTSQASPKLPTEYVREDYRKFGSGNINLVSGPAAEIVAALRGVDGRAYARAFDSFVENVHGSKRAMLAITLAERKSALAMVTSRVGSLLKSYRLIRRGRIADGINTALFKHRGPKWDVVYGKSGRPIRNYRSPLSKDDLADVWLETNFGWKPLIQDVYDAISVMRSSPSVEVVRASSTDHMLIDRILSDTSTEKWTEAGSGQKRIGIRGRVVGVNPNALLARNLGFTNPAAVLWDVIPFSFVADWFVPVSSFLGSFDAFIGVEVNGFEITVKVVSNGVHHRWWRWYDYESDSWRTAEENQHGSAMHFSRVLPSALSHPTFTDRLRPTNVDTFKVATSVALLIQQLRK